MTESQDALTPKYIIASYENYRFKAEHGWTTDRKYAKLYTKEEVLEKVKKLRKDKFKKIALRKVQLPKEDKKKAIHLKSVENAVKLVIEDKKKTIQLVETAPGKRAAEKQLLKEKLNRKKLL